MLFVAAAEIGDFTGAVDRDIPGERGGRDNGDEEDAADQPTGEFADGKGVVERGP